MLDLTKIKIGSKINYLDKTQYDERRELSSKCVVVYIFKAYEVPKTKKIIKYYGEMIIDPKYGKVFGPMQNDRIVLKRGKNDYIIRHLNKRIFNYVNLEIIKY